MPTPALPNSGPAPHKPLLTRYVEHLPGYPTHSVNSGQVPRTTARCTTQSCEQSYATLERASVHTIAVVPQKMFYGTPGSKNRDRYTPASPPSTSAALIFSRDVSIHDRPHGAYCPETNPDSPVVQRECSTGRVQPVRWNKLRTSWGLRDAFRGISYVLDDSATKTP